MNELDQAKRQIMELKTRQLAEQTAAAEPG